MPYVVRKRKGKKCVYKKNKDGTQGEKVGCTDGPIKDYLAALHINANEGLEENKMKIKPSRLREIIQEEVSDFNSRMSAPPDDITGEPDDEGAMARSQLLKLAKYSDALMGMMNDNTQLPAWVQAKITKSASYLGAVKHFIEGELELNEAVDGDPQSNTVSVERYLIQNVVNAFDEYAPAPRRDYHLVSDEADEKPASDLIDSMQALEKILKADKIPVERHLIQNVVNAFDEYAPGPRRDHYLVRDEADEKLASDLIDSMQALEKILNPVSKNAESDLNEGKQQTRKVTVEGKTYKVKK